MDAALSAGVDHVSAYALVVEDGTALARRVRRGEIARPDDDVLAHRYELLDSRLSAAGLSWYEVSNWSRARRGVPAQPRLLERRPVVGCRARCAQLRRRHPVVERQAPQRLSPSGSAVGQPPVADFERLDDRDRHIEDVLLRIRLRSGLPVAVLTRVRTAPGRRRGDRRSAHRVGDRLVLTDRGRLLADAVVRDVLD